MSTAPDQLQDHVFALTEACLRDEATAEQMAQLDHLLKTHPAARRYYLDFVHDSGSLRSWAVARSEYVEGDWPPQLPPERDRFEQTIDRTDHLLPGAKPATKSQRPKHRSRRQRRRLATGFVVAAGALVLILSAGRLLTTPDQVDPSPTVKRSIVATVLRTKDSVWREGVPRTGGDPLYASQRIQLDAGLARIRFSDGATVTLEGPAELELLSASAARLHSGTLISWVPAEAVGFRVRTKALDITDLGTSFGVAVGPNGDTSVTVFSGQIEATRPDTVDPTPVQRLVNRGESVRAIVGQPLIEFVDTNADAFHEPLKVSTGIRSVEGDCRFVTGRVTGGILPRNDAQALFGLERRDFVLPEDVTVNVRPDIENRADSKSTPIPAGTRVHCFLGQFDPPDNARGGKGHTANFRVTFDQPIIGIIAGGIVLKNSDPVFADRAPNLSIKQRASESPAPDHPREEDALVVSDDRHTIEVTARVLTNMDQVRILVDATDSNIESTEPLETKSKNE